MKITLLALALAFVQIDAFALHTPAHAASLAVMNCDDSGPGSLREAVANAASGDTIDLGGLTCGTIALASGAITTALVELTVVGPGANALAIDAGGMDRVFAGGASTWLTIRGLTLRNGRLDQAVAAGGCVYAGAGLFLTDVLVTGCTAKASGDARGGGVATDGGLQMQFTSISDCVVESAGGTARGGGAYAVIVLQADMSHVSDNIARTLPVATGLSSGGGLFIESGEHTSINGSTVSGNSAEFAGGLDLPGQNPTLPVLPLIVNSTIAGNSASVRIGGIRSERSLRVYNSTIAFNSEPQWTGGALTHATGIQLDLNAELTIDSTIIANNRMGVTEGDIGGTPGTTVSGTGGYNLVIYSMLALQPGTLMVEPMLLPLADNGGPTETLALSPGSPAINAGANSFSLVTDQRGRGHPRVFGLLADIGAFEYSDILFEDGFEPRLSEDP